MTTSLREHLILKVYTGRAGLLKAFNCVADVHNVAESCVAVRHDGDIDRLTDSVGLFEHFVKGKYTHIRLSQQATGYSISGALQRRKARFFNKLRADSVVSAGHDKYPFIKYQLLKSGCFIHAFSSRLRFEVHPQASLWISYHNKNRYTSNNCLQQFLFFIDT